MLGNTNITIKPNEKIDYVEWIESTGTQYIDTETLFENTIRTELDFELTSIISSGSTGIAGAYDGSASPYKGLLLGMNAGNFQFAYGSSFNGTTLTPSIGTRYYSVINNINKQCTINDTVLASTTSLNSNFTVNKTGYLFWTNGGTTNKISMKLYGCNIYREEILIHNFRPCKDSAGVFCLYDTIEKKYFYNKGTGYFEGPNPKQVEYIQSSGTQWMDTGVIMTSNIDVEMSFSMVAQGAGEDMLIGCWDANTNGFLLGLNKSSNYAFRYAYANSAWNGTTLAYDTNVHTAKINGTEAKIDGITLATKGDKVITSTSSIRLWHWGNRSTSSFPFAQAKIYYCKIKDNNNLIRDLVPVYIGTYCLYDMVNQKYYYNKGTGAFTGADSLFSGNTVCLLNFEDNLTDDTGLNAVTMSTGEAIYVDGKFNKSLDLNKTAYATFPLTADNTLGTNDFTIAGWFKLDDISQSTCLWSFSHYVNSSYYWQGIQVWYNAKFCFCCDISSSSKNRLNTTTTISAGTWHHVALVRSSGTVKLYLDGTSIGSLSANGTVYQNTACNWKIGSSSVYNEHPNIREGVTGQVDNFMIINGKALWTANFTPPDSPYGTSEV